MNLKAMSLSYGVWRRAAEIDDHTACQWNASSEDCQLANAMGVSCRARMINRYMPARDRGIVVVSGDATVMERAGGCLSLSGNVSQ